jgi:hypothetical protein
MTKINFDLDDLTNAALKRMVKTLLTASDGEEKSILEKLNQKAKGKPERNDLADLDEEMHGKPNTPKVEEDDLSEDGELADLPKKGKK